MNRKIQTILLIPLLLLLISSGCSRHLSKSASWKEVIVYPSPPDTARIQFLTRREQIKKAIYVQELKNQEMKDE